jgi:inosine/xanthosine triphosphatase
VGNNSANEGSKPKNKEQSTKNKVQRTKFQIITFDDSHQSVIASDAFCRSASREHQHLNPSQSQSQIKTVAVGSERAAKVLAVRAAIARIAQLDSSWKDINVVARAVETNIPAMPLTDWQLMQGARERALAVRDLLNARRLEAQLYVGLEGGFHSISIEGEWHTFLRGWAFATDGRVGYFGSSPSISVPSALVKKLIEGRNELGLVIDQVSGKRDVRSREGAWGVLSRDLVTRSMSFELALIAALAPFYNSDMYTE